MRRCYWLPMVTVVALVPAGSAMSETYQPLDPGSEWHYVNEAGLLEDMSVVGQRELLGAITAVRHEVLYDDAGYYQVVENFWTTNAEGDLWLHGSENLTDSVGIAYSPPVLMVDGPLFAGKTWTTEDIQPCFLDGTPMEEASVFDYPSAVYFEGEVVVPAGTFHGFGVGYNPTVFRFESMPGATYDMLGRRLPQGAPHPAREATEWYADGVGMLQYSYPSPADMLKLTSWQPTPVSSESWGKIKAFYR